MLNQMPLIICSRSRQVSAIPVGSFGNHFFRNAKKTMDSPAIPIQENSRTATVLEK